MTIENISTIGAVTKIFQRPKCASPKVSNIKYFWTLCPHHEEASCVHALLTYPYTNIKKMVCAKLVMMLLARGDQIFFKWVVRWIKLKGLFEKGGSTTSIYYLSLCGLVGKTTLFSDKSKYIVAFSHTYTHKSDLSYTEHIYHFRTLNPSHKTIL